MDRQDEQDKRQKNRYETSPVYPMLILVFIPCDTVLQPDDKAAARKVG